MFRALIEVAGAFFANAPVSDDAAGRVNRVIAVTIFVAAIFTFAGLAARH